MQINAIPVLFNIKLCVIPNRIKYTFDFASEKDDEKLKSRSQRFQDQLNDEVSIKPIEFTKIQCVSLTLMSYNSMPSLFYATFTLLIYFTLIYHKLYLKIPFH